MWHAQREAPFWEQETTIPDCINQAIEHPQSGRPTDLNSCLIATDQDLSEKCDLDKSVVVQRRKFESPQQCGKLEQIILSGFPLLSRTMATRILIVPESLQVISSSPHLSQANYTEISNWGYLVFSAWFRFPKRFQLGTIYLQVLRLKKKCLKRFTLKSLFLW